ncbi:DNA processing protein DprA [Agaricicola taiwanensis]|uniref:DNA processing protein DprA n=1 Tax=Agaricicola taiwanensis TaxID=591372 RepID=A0A8J3DYE6_9RHOB|nr:DNA-processing protein DprA [Agaricicola taiwanensis]GGE47204.1 DNA processing protein DprA [Agaricicola taiwanensis]
MTRGEPLKTRGDQERIDWLQLYRSDNVGPASFRSLLSAYGSAQAALEALPEIAARGGARKLRLCSRSEAEREYAALMRLGGFLVTCGEPDFPPLLAEAEGAPPLLQVLGHADVLARPSVAIVGGRNASAAGRTFASQLASALGAMNYVIVSGLARGVDGAAHKGALRGGTIAAIAGGLDRIYPPEHADLVEQMIDAGSAVVSEMPLGWVARAQDFPRRNRIIAGIAQGTVLIEAAMRSGSLITARLAGELGREVMAAPGSPLDPRCEGSNRLIRDGATLITNADHVVEALAPLGLPLFSRQDQFKEEQSAAILPVGIASDDLREAVIQLLGPSPATIDDIVRHSTAPAQEVQMVLLELELAGRLDRLSGGRIALTG